MKPRRKVNSVRNRAALGKFVAMLMPFLFVAWLLAFPGGEFWEKKEFAQWSQKECRRLLEDSPWSKQLNLQSVVIMQSGARNATTGSEQQPYIKYQAQFRSALPIRQATVRQMQIVQKYESLSPEQRQQFDKQAEAFISADVADWIIVYVSYTTNSQTYELELARHWQSQTAELLKNSVFLIPSKGDRIALANFAVAPGGQRYFQFIFPRQVSGRPIIGPQDKSIRLEFAYPIIGSMGDGRAFLEFKLEKMIFHGNIEY
jgi:predicted NUDIX family NTP pyrophosphohydrolase